MFATLWQVKSMIHQSHDLRESGGRDHHYGGCNRAGQETEQQAAAILEGKQVDFFCQAMQERPVAELNRVLQDASSRLPVIDGEAVDPDVAFFFDV